jgi:UDP-3-O-[3-hydroxymyristoyl] glucosamine N-acyltransferase
MEITLEKLSKNIKGKLKGDPLKIIQGVAAFNEAASFDITFIDSKKILNKLGSTKAGAVIIPDDLTCNFENIISVENPRVAFAKVILLFHPPKQPDYKISKFAQIDESTKLGKNVSIGDFTNIGKNALIGDGSVIHPQVYIGDNVSIGEDTVIFPNVTIKDGSIIGKCVIIQAGSVIGSDGFGYVHDGKKYNKVPHVGIVQIDDEVEIGAGNTIDRGTLGKTWIKKGVKTDNLVHVAHNVTIGENTLLIAHSGIAGSTTIGKNVIIAGQAGVAGQLNIGDGVIIGPKAGVTKNVEAGKTVSGTPEMPHKLWLKVHSILQRLPDMKKRLEKLEKKNV